eukprot:scaffold98089_cov22-Prasinocladus_malaysianus.AAC.1
MGRLKLSAVAAHVCTWPQAGHPHPWLGAYSAWRYSQMLQINPKRGHEVEDWASVALSLWPATGIDGPIDETLGGLEVFKACYSAVSHTETTAKHNLILSHGVCCWHVGQVSGIRCPAASPNSTPSAMQPENLKSSNHIDMKMEGPPW